MGRVKGKSRVGKSNLGDCISGHLIYSEGINYEEQPVGFIGGTSMVSERIFTLYCILLSSLLYPHEQQGPGEGTL